MNLIVRPSPILKGVVRLPASKSYTIRSFLIAACGGTSKIIHPSDCDDAWAAVRAARYLGADIVRLQGNVWKVTAHPKFSLPPRIHVGESGTVLRFILPLLALKGNRVTVSGKGTLRGRPNFFLTQALRERGVAIRGKGRQEGIPISIKGGAFAGGKIRIDGSLSSQFISALLIACPQIGEDTSLTLTGRKIVSTDYIVMTMQVLRESGVSIEKKGAREYRIRGKQKFQGLKNFKVPSDYGLAAFLMAAAILTKSDLVLKGSLREDLLQADGHIIPLLRKMGARFQKTSRVIRIHGPFHLKGGDFSLKDCPDLVPIMSILALFAKGRTRLYHIAHARVKESDRISDLRGELIKIGAQVTEKSNEIVIYPQEHYKSDTTLDPHNDHRLAMSFAVLGIKLGARVPNIGCVAKSYPEFVCDLKAMGVNFKQTNKNTYKYM
jgi:3-phosphoshikimate 1-carboxyvinyltransferase